MNNSEYDFDWLARLLKVFAVMFGVVYALVYVLFVIMGVEDTRD